MKQVYARSVIVVMTLALAPGVAWGGPSRSVHGVTRGPTGVCSSDSAVAWNTALIDSLHRIAQTAALADWNHKIAGTMGQFGRHPRLTPQDLKRPSRIDHSGHGWQVIYGGFRPGPFIIVWVNERGLADSARSRFVPS